MNTAIIIPTVNVPTNLRDWAAQLQPNKDIIIIAGSERTPHDEVRAFIDTLPVETTYLHPDDHEVLRWEVERYHELNHHHRRNFALLEALSVAKKRDIKRIITIDDDNYPNSINWVSNVVDILDIPNVRPVVDAKDGWWNAGELCEPTVTHRGYPISQRLTQGKHRYLSPSNERIGVIASLWVGDPDIDAIERIALNPQVKYLVESVTLAKGTWCPFDTQSTTVHIDLAPMMAMWTGVGRYDDIWCSYLMRAVMDVFGWHVTYGYPAVRQDRNQHDLLKDLDNEMLGYRRTDDLCRVLRECVAVLEVELEDGHTLTPWDAWKELVENISDRCAWLPHITINTLRAWARDVDSLELMK